MRKDITPEMVDQHIKNVLKRRSAPRIPKQPSVRYIGMLMQEAVDAGLVKVK